MTDEVEEFLSEHPDVAEKACDILRSAHPDVQQMVIARGTLNGTSNPSGALISRVNAAAGRLGLDSGKGEAKGGGSKGSKGKGKNGASYGKAPYGGDGAAWDDWGVPKGCGKGGFDPWSMAKGGKAAAKAAAIAEATSWILGMGGMGDWGDWGGWGAGAGADDAWSGGCGGKGGQKGGAFWGEEPPAKRPRREEEWGFEWGSSKGDGGKGGKGAARHYDGDSSSEVEHFLMNNAVADKAAMILRSAAPEVQLRVIDRGSLHDCKNPSGALISRVNKEAEMLGQKGGGFGGKGSY